MDSYCFELSVAVGVNNKVIFSLLFGLPGDRERVREDSWGRKKEDRVKG